MKELVLTQDIVFILPPDFDDDGKLYYCRECAEIVGLLAYYPQLHDLLDVRLVDYPRPRREMIETLGSEAQQNCPMLVAANDAPIHGVTYIDVAGHKIVEGAKQIGRYLAIRHGIGQPHP